MKPATYEAMNNPSLGRNLLASLAVLLAASVLSGCMSAKARLAAAKAVDDLRVQMTAQDDAQQKAVEAMVRQVLENQRATLRTRVALKKQELKLQVYERCEAQLNDQQRKLSDEINKALDPVERRLKGEIDVEAARGAAGEDKANTLRLQLASTLAFVQREASKNEMELAQRLVEERTKLLQQVDEAFKSVPVNIDAPVSDAELDAILAGYRAHQEEFRTGVQKASEALTDYVTAPEAWKLVLKGLLPSGLFAKLEPKLTEKLANAQSALENSLSNASSSLLKSFEDRIANIKK